jgi:hypothetical protein
MWAYMLVRIAKCIAFLLLLATPFVYGCRVADTPVAATDPTPSMDEKLVGTWYTRAKYAAAASEGYQIAGDGKIFRLVVDAQNKLQYDPLADPGQFNTPQPDICTFTFADKDQDTVRIYTQTWVYQFRQNDSVLALMPYPRLGPGVPTYETDYVRRNIGDAVR